MSDQNETKIPGTDLVPVGEGIIPAIKRMPTEKEIRDFVTAGLRNVPEIQEATNARDMILEKGSNIDIVDSGPVQQEATEIIGEINALLAAKGQVFKAFEQYVGGLYAAWNTATKYRKDIIDDLTEESKRLGVLVGAYDKKLELERQAVQAKINEAAAVEEERLRQQALRDAERQQKRGLFDMAEKTMNRIDTVHVPAPQVPEPPRKVKTEAGKSVKFVDIYSFKTTNHAALKRWIVENKYYECLAINIPKLTTILKEENFKGGVYPQIGIIVYIDRIAK